LGLFRADQVQTTVEATGETTQLLLSEAPFFASKFRWID
jgi:hypothetical protein